MKVIVATILGSAFLVLACSTSAESSATPPQAAAVDAGLVELGKEAVARRSCADCHQSADSRDGLLSGQAVPRPGTDQYAPNLTPDPETGLGAWTPDQIAHAMRDGFDARGHLLCITMPRFNDMSDEEALAIATYLAGLSPVHRAIPPSHCGGIKPFPDAGDEGGADAAAE